MSFRPQRSRYSASASWLTVRPVRHEYRAASWSPEITHHRSRSGRASAVVSQSTRHSPARVRSRLPGCGSPCVMTWGPPASRPGRAGRRIARRPAAAAVRTGPEDHGPAPRTDRHSRDAQAGQGLVDGLAGGQQLQWLAGHLDALRDRGMQPGQHVDDRGPVAVVTGSSKRPGARRGTETASAHAGCPECRLPDQPSSHRGDDNSARLPLPARPLSASPPAGRHPHAARSLRLRPSLARLSTASQWYPPNPTGR